MNAMLTVSCCFFFSSRRRHTRFDCDWSSDVCSSDLLNQQTIIADIGSGTGILSELFLKNGNRVFGIEPNAPMREGGEKFIEQYPKFVSIEGFAEATTLSNNSIDFVVAGQAFHWFDQKLARD